MPFMNVIFRLIFVLLCLSASSSRAGEGARLADAFEREVAVKLNVPESAQARYAFMLDAALKGVAFSASQYLILVDRNSNVQALFIYFLELPAARLHFIGASPVSTGKPGQFDYFFTPTGVFAHTLENLDYRAEGTFNKNGIRGLGLKGIRVFDFGWAMAERGWDGGGRGQMRLLMHATDPDFLEPYLGVARSKGCVRIPATLNVFIDRYGLLDADYLQALENGEKMWMLRADRTPTAWPGRYLIIIDSASRERPDWAPLPGKRRAHKP
jgi:hypothetical protein